MTAENKQDFANHHNANTPELTVVVIWSIFSTSWWAMIAAIMVRRTDFI